MNKRTQAKLALQKVREFDVQLERAIQDYIDSLEIKIALQDENINELKQQVESHVMFMDKIEAVTKSIKDQAEDQ